MRYLEQQLSLRQRLGKAVAVAGIAMSALNVHAQGTAVSALPASNLGQEVTDSTLQKELPVKSMLREGEKGIIWRGQLVDKEGEPIIGASILRTDIPKDRDMGAVTNVDGRFAVEVPVGAELTFYYIGFVNVVKTIENDNPSTQVMMEDEMMLGEVQYVVGRLSYDDVYGRYRIK